MTIAPTQLGALYTRGTPIVLRRARALSGDEQWSREVVQAVFVRVLERPSHLEEMRDPVQWLYRTTTRVCLERLRCTAGEALLPDHAACPEGPGASVASGSSVAIARLAASLPPPLDQVAIYAWLDGMGRSEIASVLGCSEAAAGRMLRSARQLLVDQLDQVDAVSAR